MDPGQQQQRRILTPEDVKLAIEASRRLEYAISDENVARRSSLPSSSLDSFHVMSLPTLRIRRSSDDATAPLGTGSVASAQNTQQRRSMLRLGSPFGQRPLRASAPVLGSGNGVYHRADVQRAIRATHRRGDSNVRDPNGEQAQAGENRTGKTVMEVLADRGLLFADVAKTAVPDSSQGDSSGEQPQLHASEPTPSHEDSQAPSTTHQPTAFTTPPPHYRHPGLQTMGIVRAYCMSRTAGPGENVEHLTPIRDDSDSCDSLLSDTPTFPNDVQESLPSLTEERQEDMSSTPGDTIIQAPRQEHAPKTTDDTLQSDSAISDEAGLLSKTAELSLTTNTALTAEISGTSPTSALPQIKDATDSLIARLMMQSPPSPPPPPRSQNPINGNGQPALLRKTENDLPPRPEVSAVNSNHSFMFPGPGAPGKKSGKAGKKGNKGHGHAKTGSLNSIKHNDNGNSSSQRGHSKDEAVNRGKVESKPGPAKSKPPAQRLQSEGHTAGRRRRRNSSATSMSTFVQRKVSPRDNVKPFPQENTKILSGQSTTSVEPGMMGPPSIPSISRQSSDTSIGYNKSKTIEYPGSNFSQRGSTESSGTFPTHSQTKPIEQGAQPPQQFYTPPPGNKQWQRTFNGFQPLGPLQQTHQGSNGYNQSRNGSYRAPMQPPLQATHYHQNYQHPVRRGFESNAPYGVHRNQQQTQQSFQSYNSNFQHPQQQYHQQQTGMPHQNQAVQTAPPTPHRNHRFIANTGFSTSFARNNGAGGHARKSSLGTNRGHIRNRSFQSQSQSENGANAFRSTLVQEERYIRRTPSPPPIVKLSVRDKKLLWPIGPFIPWNVWGCPPWEMDSTNFVNVLCTNVGILRLPFSIPFLRLLRSMLKSNHGDHVITFPTMLANAENMAPYWERCYYAQQFLWKNARYFNWKPFEELPQSEWPKVEILLGSDNLKDSKWDVYLRQTDEKRLLFRCVEQKLGEDDKEPKATFFVTVHQTGVNQVQYSDPTTRDPDIPLPPLDGSPDPRILPEYQYTLPNYLCLNESRGLNTHGFVDIGVPAKRLNFHPFGPRNFDQLWYGMAHLQELVCADDNKSLGTLRPDQDPDTVFGKGKAEELKERTTTMMGHGGPKFLTHEEILVMNFHVPSEE